MEARGLDASVSVVDSAGESGVGGGDGKWHRFSGGGEGGETIMDIQRGDGGGGGGGGPAAALPAASPNNMRGGLEEEEEA